MILLYNKSSKSCSLKTDGFQDVCEFSNVNITETVMQGVGVYNVFTLSDMCKVCTLPIGTTTIVRADEFLSARVSVTYTEQEQQSVVVVNNIDTQEQSDQVDGFEDIEQQPIAD